MIEFTEADIAALNADPATLQDKITGLRELSNRELNGWEQRFLDSVESRLAEGRSLTAKQYETLLSIHSRHFGD